MSGIAFAGFGPDCACAGGCARSAIAARLALAEAGSLVRTPGPGALNPAAVDAIGWAICATAEFAAGTAEAGAEVEAEAAGGKFAAGGADSIRVLDFAPGNTWK